MLKFLQNTPVERTLLKVFEQFYWQHFAKVSAFSTGLYAIVRVVKRVLMLHFSASHCL